MSGNRRFARSIAALLGGLLWRVAGPVAAQTCLILYGQSPVYVSDDSTLAPSACRISSSIGAAEA